MALALVSIAACGGDGEVTGPGDERGIEQAEGEQIMLSAAQIAAAGIEFFEVGPGLVETRLLLPAIVEPDVNATSHVTPKAPGVIRSVHVGLGERVQVGELLCEIDSVELGVAVAEYRRSSALAAVAVEQLSSETQLYAKRYETLIASLDGLIEVRKGILDREKELREKQVSTVRPLLEAERAFREAELSRGVALTELETEWDARIIVLRAGVKVTSIEEMSALGRLAALGVRDSTVEDILRSDDVYSGTYPLRSARSGVITARSLSVGRYVEVGEELFEIQDISRVWVMASVFEDSLRHVEEGQSADVTLHAFPGEIFRGKTRLFGMSLDAESRSLALRIELENGGVESWSGEYPFRPGMFGDVSLVIESHLGELTVPESAIVHEVDSDVVFVRTSAGHFEKRRVRVLGGDSELVEVVMVNTEGEVLRAGEEVAVSGTFVLKSLASADALIGHDDH